VNEAKNSCGKSQSNRNTPPLGTVAAMADGLRQRDAAGLSGQEQGHEGEPAEFVHVGGGVFWPSRPGQQQSSCEPPRII
jgi:hypothetical protein